MARRTHEFLLTLVTVSPIRSFAMSACVRACCGLCGGVVQVNTFELTSRCAAAADLADGVALSEVLLEM